MKTLKSIIAILFSCSLFSCAEEVISLDLETSEPRLVIDASIDWVKNTSGNNQKIKLSTTTGYYSEQFPSVSGATIEVKGPSGTVFNFRENPGSGEYFCNNFMPVVGQEYTLSVSLNGNTYKATETLIDSPDIKLTIDQNNTGGMAGDEIEIVYYYQDDATKQNNYLYSISTPWVTFPQYSAESDENNQGSLTPVYYSSKDLKPGDTVSIKLYGISRRYYDFFRKLLSASGSDDSPFPTIPGSVRGNIINQTNSANFAYGYFRLSEVDVKHYTIQ